MRHSWYYYIGGLRTLVASEITRDNSVKTIERYKIASAVVGSRQLKLIKARTVREMTEGAVRFGHLDNLKLLAAVRGKALSKHLGYHALRGQNGAMLTYLASALDGHRLLHLGKKKITKLATKVGPGLFDLVAKHKVVAPPSHDKLVTAIIGSGRVDVADRAHALALWKQPSRDLLVDALLEGPDAHVVVWFDWLLQQGFLRTELVLDYVKDRMGTWATGPKRAARLAVAQQLAGRYWYGVSSAAIGEAAFTGLLQRPEHGEYPSRADVELLDWFAVTLGRYEQRF